MCEKEVCCVRACVRGMAGYSVKINSDQGHDVVFVVEEEVDTRHHELMPATQSNLYELVGKTSLSSTAAAAARSNLIGQTGRQVRKCYANPAAYVQYKMCIEE